ncbi:PF11999 family protein [Leptospira weilii serovar Ranarum str. ICFT]|uniref:PF11999 family protein n=1 Tax=Leptospira weilii serovar Ranarum str. ICFT TaxID=1218598 RepID=N1WHW7_9LEPT|nr:ice-binding family protein [Leptospira weilii]EMY78525.1 PF11999 family protein [Leptospira weilii serovar Ranarum str. ICFT]
MKIKANMKLSVIGALIVASFMNTITCESNEPSNLRLAATLYLLGVNTETAGPSAPDLRSAATFASFGGGAGITNQGTITSITGDMGTTGASTMITGFHNLTCGYTETPLNIGAVSGTIYTNVPSPAGVTCTEGTAATFEAATTTAADALAAFNDLASRPNGMDPGAGQLGGLTLIPGVYKSAAGPFLITGSDLTLDAQGNADAVWIFQMASALTVGAPAAPRSVILVNGAQAKNVYWQVGSAATINGAGGGTMVGTIIASAGITFSTAGNLTPTTLNGRALGLFASVTMVNTIINSSGVPAAVQPATAPVSGVTVTGSTSADVVGVVSGGGYINVENNGGHVAATETGTGTINIVNNGGVLTATNTGNGVMTIHSNATGAVTVTNTGNGNVTVNATGAAAIALTHTGDDDYIYP